LSEIHLITTHFVTSFGCLNGHIMYLSCQSFISIYVLISPTGIAKNRLDYNVSLFNHPLHQLNSEQITKNIQS